MLAVATAIRPIVEAEGNFTSMFVANVSENNRA